ncbi:MAG TPA: 2OG-Fe(II) oxygenase [Rhizomicrobium sp.]|nr:2OG-Fe(II) oxygenase [Rhizomicrobium sp.]
MAKLLSDYVKVYENTLAPARCETLIGRFEASQEQHERMEAERSYSFAELNVSRHWPEVEAEIFGVMMGCIQKYWEALQIGGSWPKQVDAERVRLKRYLPGGKDKFPTHVDVMNSEQSRRFLTAILYLNEPGGGETVFPHLDLIVKPAAGRMVVFPPLWLFPHAGLPPRDRAKYILHRYLWYPPASVSPSTP